MTKTTRADKRVATARAAYAESIEQAREYNAKRDLARARKRGFVLIGPTRYGRVHLAYSRTERTYKVTYGGTDAWLLTEGRLGIVKPVLKDLYAIT